MNIGCGFIPFLFGVKDRHVKNHKQIVVILVNFRTLRFGETVLNIQIMKTILKGNGGEIGTDGSIISDSHPEYLPPNPGMQERDAKALAERIMGLRKGSEEWIHIGEDPQVGNFFSAGILKFFGNMMRNPGGDQGGKGGKKGDGGGKGGKKK